MSPKSATGIRELRHPARRNGKAAPKGGFDPVVVRSRLPRSQHHHHLAAFELRLGLHLGDGQRVFLDLHQELHAEFLVGHFAAAELQRHLDLVALFEEAVHRLHLHVIVMRVDVRAHLDFLDLDDLLLLARFGRLLLVGVFQLAQVKDLADGRFGVRRNLHEIEAGFFGHAERLIGRDDTVVVAVGIDKLNPGNPDFLVGARAVLDGSFRFEGSANGRVLLELFR
nr:hypothetical protein SHINE37_44271 [Rhizobiaceae bacterium]